MNTKYAFLDTNIFLHFVGVDQIDWLHELSCDHVVLVVAPIIIQQLNEKKDSPGSRKLRDRAGSALKKLDLYSEQEPPIKIREGVELRFRPNEPLIDFATHRLSSVVSDDRVVASILEFKGETPGSAIVLVTGDVGLKLKAGNQNIQTVKISGRFKLPEEVDDSQKRIRELEEQVLQLESRIPRMKLVFQDDSNNGRVQFIRVPQPTKDSIRRKMEEVRCMYPKADTAFEMQKQQLEGIAAITPAEFDDYNARIAQFWTSFDNYLKEEVAFYDWHQRLMKLELFLINDGSCPAERIEIFMHFPDAMNVLEQGELAQPPQMPSPPTGPMSPVAKLVGLFLEGSRRFETNPSEVRSSPSIYSNVSRPTIERSNGCRVRITVQELMHHSFRISIGELYLAFRSWESVHSFKIAYSLFASNIPRKVEDTLHVKVEWAHEIQH